MQSGRKLLILLKGHPGGLQFFIFPPSSIMLEPMGFMIRFVWCVKGQTIFFDKAHRGVSMESYESLEF